jgi:glycosyltransferase involved in cell wall biosynthesis
MPSPKVSIAICTFNRCGPLGEALRSLGLLTTNGDLTYEIVVVDDGSTDATRETVETFSSTTSIPVIYSRQAGLGIAAARNHCIRRSRGEWIAFFDDDQLANPDWLQRLYSFALQRNIQCVGSARDLRIPDCDPATLPSVTRAVLGELQHPEAHECARKPMLSTGTVLIHRSVFDAVGGFDESILHGGSDTDLFVRMRRHGFKLWFTPDAICHHLIPSHRLKAKFLLWCSMRNGVSFARVDSRDLGRPAAVGLGIARLGRDVLVALPKAAWFAASGKRAHATGQLCLVWRDIGYVRQVVGSVFSNVTGRSRFLSSLNYRNERQTVGS